MALKESDKRALAFLAVAGTGALIYLYVMPMFDTYQKREVEIQDLVRELRLAHRKAENMGGLNAEVEVLKYRLADLKKVLPTEEGSFELIEKLQGLAAFSGVRVSGISIEERKERGEGWSAVGFRIEGSSYWFQFIDFLWRLENFERIIDVSVISLTPETMEPGQKAQRFQIVLSANVYSSTIGES
ncbi:type 4a pilus biogenesis protein PilO [bacterium]|nr:type 4a pilus biogenesis protein PilO [bacterium]